MQSYTPGKLFTYFVKTSENTPGTFISKACLNHKCRKRVLTFQEWASSLEKKVGLWKTDMDLFYTFF